MKRKIGILLAVILIAAVFMGGKNLLIDDSQVENDSGLTKEQEEKRSKIKQIYTTEYQEQVSEELAEKKQEETYTL